MGKFRSKLKGARPGARWPRGQASTSNPKAHRHRDAARSRFFHENLGNTGLTQEAVLKHNAITTYGHSTGKERSQAENELTMAKKFENMSVKTGDDGSESQCSGSEFAGTYKTFQTFASDWSTCSNVSFSKLLNKFDSNNAMHKEMLAILAAVTEVLKEQGGAETTTEYFAALMETLKATEGEESLAATLNLLCMGIKSVSQPVLRKQFSSSAAVFTGILEKYANSDSALILRSAVGCLSVLLRAQEYAVWGDSSTMKVFDAMLAFVLHSRPKIRKAAQHAVTSVLRGSCFVVPIDDQTDKVIKIHPASGRVAECCLAQLKAEALLGGHKSVLHTLTLLRDVIAVFSRDSIKACCEAILSLMTHNNIYIKTCCLHTIHALLSVPRASSNLTPALAVQLCRALMAARPSAADTAQALAWATVMQQAYSCLASLDLNLCLPNLPNFVNICVTELWLSEAMEINASATNALKIILVDCVKPAIDSDDSYLRHKSHVENIFKTIGTGLDNPFNQAIKHVILTIASCFEIANERVASPLRLLLKQLNERRESHNFHNHKEVEYATGCAVKSLGPEFVLQCIPLRDDPETINLERSWLLPVLKERISKSNLKFFATDILEMATLCRKKCRELKEQKDMPGSHTYDLLCNQFWALLPSFCNAPSDIKGNFKAIAKVLGAVLKDNPEFRLSVMQAVRKLINCSIENENEDDVMELARFAKNFLPILLNVYMSPVKGSTADGQRLAALETIQVYLIITDQTLREELFLNAIQQLETSGENHLQRESILDVIRLLVLYQSEEKIAALFEQWVYPLCETVLEDAKQFKKAKKAKINAMEEGEVKEEAKKNEMKYKDKARMLEMEHKKAYRVLEEIFKCDKENCKKFLTANHKKIKRLLISSLNKVADSSKAARLRCIQHLIDNTPYLNAESKLLKSAVAESVICTRDINSKCRQGAFDLLNSVGTVLKGQEEGMSNYTKMLLSGVETSLPRLVNASVRALASALYNFSEEMGVELVQGLLEKVCELMVSPNREIVTACLSFLKVYVKVLPSEVLSGSLPVMFRSLSAIPEDCKRHSRTELGYFLTRMIRKYGAGVVEKLVPRSDEVMLRRLRNLRKLEGRKKRQNESQRSQAASESEFDAPIRGTSRTLEDILRDSDSEMEFLEDEEPKKSKAKSKSRNQAWIQDDPENIVDLADVSAARNITATDPKNKRAPTEAQKQKKKDGGFKMAPDGRLIIADDGGSSDGDNDEPKASGDIASDSSDTGDEGEARPSKLLKPGAKRKYDDILSIKSGRSGRSRTTTTASTKYRAGGKGIHRPLKSSAASTAGTDYRSKKAKGDIKKKGQPEPYAYMPLSRKNLNKRKRTTNANQFKGVVKAKTKGVKLRSKKGRQ